MTLPVEEPETPRKEVKSGKKKKTSKKKAYLTKETKPVQSGSIGKTNSKILSQNQTTL
jgi:hypothetical protein